MNLDLTCALEAEGRCRISVRCPLRGVAEGYRDALHLSSFRCRVTEPWSNAQLGPDSNLTPPILKTPAGALDQLTTSINEKFGRWLERSRAFPAANLLKPTPSARSCPHRLTGSYVIPRRRLLRSTAAADFQRDRIYRLDICT